MDQYTKLPVYDAQVQADCVVECLDLKKHSIGIGGVNSEAPSKEIVEGIGALKPRFMRIFLQEFFACLDEEGYHWEKLDQFMDAVHGMCGQVMASICLKPPVLYPTVDECIWQPSAVEKWQELITALVHRYSVEKPYVTYWAVGNEINIGEYGGCPYKITAPEDYYAYYAMTVPAILAAYPQAKVGGAILGRFHGWGGTPGIYEQFS